MKSVFHCDSKRMSRDVNWQMPLQYKPFKLWSSPGINNWPSTLLIYINDLPNCLSLGSPRMYADDTNSKRTDCK